MVQPVSQRPIAKPPAPRPIPRAEAVAPPPPPAQDSYLATAGELVGDVVWMPVNAVLFVGNTTLMLARLTRYQLLHPFNMDIPRLMRWVAAGASGEPPTDDVGLLALLIGTQNAGFAALMTEHADLSPAASADAAKVMKWAIATQGKGCPPTHDPRLLVKLIGMQNADFAGLMTRFMDRYPRAGADAAAVMRWAIETRGKGVPPTHHCGLLASLIRTQNAEFANMMDGYVQKHPRAAKDVAKVMRWAIETHGKGVPPTNDPHLLGTLISTQRKDFGGLMLTYLAKHPRAGADVAAVERWAIATQGKGVPPTHDPALLATLIGTAEPRYGKLFANYLAANPGSGPEVAKVERWAIETRGKGVPPTADPKLLGTLIQTQEPAFGTLMLGYLAEHPADAADVAAVERWAIETRGVGVPPTHNATLLGTLIKTKEPAFGQFILDRAAHPDAAAVARWAIETQGKGAPPTREPRLLGDLVALKEPAIARTLLAHLDRVPTAGPELAKVLHWAIATKGEGRPPTDDPRLLATLIGVKEPVLAARLDAYAAKHPKRAADTARCLHWVIETKGAKLALPPSHQPGLVWLLARFGVAKWWSGK